MREKREKGVGNTERDCECRQALAPAAHPLSPVSMYFLLSPVVAVNAKSYIAVAAHVTLSRSLSLFAFSS